MIKTALLATAVFGVATMAAMAEGALVEQTLPLAFDNQDGLTTGAVDKKPQQPVPLLRYKSSVNDKGRIVVEFDEEKSTSNAKPRDVMTVFAPDVRFTEILLHSQDWYLQVDPNGTMQGIYTVPRNQALPSSVLRSMGDGFGLLKVNPANSFFKVFPSKLQLASQLTTFMEAARETTCEQPRRPETITATVDVKPGWSAAGKINFSASWKVSELCKEVKEAKAIKKDEG
ncbi:hypothetical protein ACFQ14_16555 [Pseudahrensia aquimaris]|uniref:DUF4384 domain-containing protein n=1 Tax=Pseudahrensia aquimaris TaxID=744461 RepID=A0ABW3FL83_9HYPH